MNVRLEPWAEGDLPLLERLLGDSAMTQYLGGPETPEQLAKRQKRYEVPGSGMFKIVDEETREAVGSVGYWEREWDGGRVYETGWSVLPEFQGRGYASAGTALVVERARVERKHRYLHAYPSVDNGPSNGICRKLGFELRGDHEFEYQGAKMRCNDWRLDLESREPPLS